MPARVMLVRNDIKYRYPAGVGLGRSFLEAGFVQEAVETLASVINAYPIKGDEIHATIMTRKKLEIRATLSACASIRQQHMPARSDKTPALEAGSIGRWRRKRLCR